jgi:hypothetical protein
VVDPTLTAVNLTSPSRVCGSRIGALDLAALPEQETEITADVVE